jgi:hypothetical protein
MSTPPYGQNYGYGNGSPATPASEPRRHNGTGSHARPEGTGDGTRPVRQANPRDSRQATGRYRGNGSYPGNGGSPANGGSQGPVVYPGNSSYPANGYPANGYNGNGHRAPYDPRDDYRRLTHQH